MYKTHTAVFTHLLHFLLFLEIISPDFMKQTLIKGNIGVMPWNGQQLFSLGFKLVYNMYVCSSSLLSLPFPTKRAVKIIPDR